MKKYFYSAFLILCYLVYAISETKLQSETSGFLILVLLLTLFQSMIRQYPRSSVGVWRMMGDYLSFKGETYNKLCALAIIGIVPFGNSLSVVTYALVFVFACWVAINTLNQLLAAIFSESTRKWIDLGLVFLVLLASRFNWIVDCLNASPALLGSQLLGFVTIFTMITTTLLSLLGVLLSRSTPHMDNTA